MQCFQNSFIFPIKNAVCCGIVVSLEKERFNIAMTFMPTMTVSKLLIVTVPASQSQRHQKCPVSSGLMVVLF